MAAKSLPLLPALLIAGAALVFGGVVGFGGGFLIGRVTAKAGAALPFGAPAAADERAKAKSGPWASQQEFEAAVLGKRTDEVVELLGPPATTRETFRAGVTDWLYMVPIRSSAGGEPKKVPLTLKIRDARVIQVL